MVRCVHCNRGHDRPTSLCYRCGKTPTNQLPKHIRPLKQQVTRIYTHRARVTRAVLGDYYVTAQPYRQKRKVDPGVAALSRARWKARRMFAAHWDRWTS